MVTDGIHYRRRVVDELYGGTVSLLDTHTGRIVHTARVGRQPLFLIVDRTADRAFVVNQYGQLNGNRSAGAVDVLDTTDGRVLRTTAVGNPFTYAIDEAARRVFIGSDEPTGRVSVLDATTGAVLHTVAVGDAPQDIEVDPRTAHTFVLGQDSVTMLDTRSGAVLRTTHVNPDLTTTSSLNAAVDEVTGRLVVVTDRGTLLVLDTHEGSVVRTANIGEGSQPIALDEKTGRAFVIPGSGDVDVLDTRSGHLTRTIHLPTGGEDLALDARTGRLFVVADGGLLGGNVVHVVDTVGWRLVRTTQIGDLPRAIAVDETSGRVFVVNRDSATVSILDANNGSLVRTTRIGPVAEPNGSAVYALAIDEGAGRVFVTRPNPRDTGGGDPGNGSVYILNATSGDLIASRPVGVGPSLADVDPHRDRALIVNVYGTALPPCATTLTLPGNASTRTGHPSIMVHPASVRPGGQVTILGQDFEPGETVTFALDGVALPITSSVSDADGRVGAAFAAPPHAGGPGPVFAIGSVSRTAASAPLMNASRATTRLYLTGALGTPSEHPAVALLNAGPQPAHVALTVFSASGRTTAADVTVAGFAQITVAPVGRVADASAFGLSIAADRPVAAALVLSHDGLPVRMPGRGLGSQWYFARGDTASTSGDMLSILNPALAVVHVRLRLLIDRNYPGEAKEVDITVPAHSDKPVDAERLMPGGARGIVAVADRPVLVERIQTARTIERTPVTWTGATTPAMEWLFAQGSGQGATHLSFLNTENFGTEVMACFYRHGALIAHATEPLYGNATTVIDNSAAAYADAAIVTSDQAVIAEGFEDAQHDGAPVGVGGVSGVATDWSFPGAGSGEKERLLLYNPSSVAVSFNVTLYGRDTPPVMRRGTLMPKALVALDALDLRRLSPNATGLYGLVVRSLGGQGIVARLAP